MSRKMRKTASSLSYRLRKLYWRIITLKPSAWVVGGILMGIVIFLISGGLYDILESPIPFGSDPRQRNRPLFFYPAINYQFLVESILIFILFGLGAVGFILVYQSTKYAYRPRQAYILLTVGLALVTISYILVEVSLNMKT